MNEQTEQATLPEDTGAQSLRDQIAENLSAAVESETPAAQEQTQEVSTAEPQKPGRLSGRQRDETGKLLPGKAVAHEQSATPTQAQRPSSWKKEHWADFDKIAAENPALAAYLHERESQYAKGVSTYKQEWEHAKPLIDAIAPFQPILQQHGINAASWITNLGNAHHRLAMGSPQDKVAMFQQLARDYQVPVQLAVQGQNGQWQLLGQAPQPQQPAFDPSMITRMVQQELQAASTKQALDAFTAEAPKKYPHFEAVKQTMAGLLQAGLADDLPSAYNAALRHPNHADLFAAAQEQERAQQEAEARSAQKQKVNRARANTVSIASSTPSGNVKSESEKGLRDEIATNLRAVVGGRV